MRGCVKYIIAQKEARLEVFSRKSAEGKRDRGCTHPGTSHRHRWVNRSELFCTPTSHYFLIPNFPCERLSRIEREIRAPVQRDSRSAEGALDCSMRLRPARLAQPREPFGIAENATLVRCPST